MKTLVEFDWKTSQFYNRVLFDLVNNNYDLNKITAEELNYFFLVQYADDFKKFIKQAIADEDELFDYCDNANLDYKELYNKIEKYGFDLV